jgi:hypothetical protein
MTYAATIEKDAQGSSVEVSTNVESTNVSDRPSKVELLSYGICCAAQGLVGILYFALVVIVPVAASRGLFSHLL